MSDTDHAGRIAVVTGGARGFGKAFGQALADAGARVVLADIDLASAAEAAAEIGASAEAAACDVSDVAQFERMVADIVARHGGIDILINNAGLHSTRYNRPMAEMGLDEIRRLFEVNVMGVIAGSLAARAAMRGRPGAAIVNISSIAAYGSPTIYGASKLAVQGVTMALAREFAADGIRVNAIAPGLILTETIRAELPQAYIDGAMTQQIVKRGGEERDIVEAMLFLVSARSAFVAGETLRISGGFALSV